MSRSLWFFFNNQKGRSSGLDEDAAANLVGPAVGDNDEAARSAAGDAGGLPVGQPAGADPLPPARPGLALSRNPWPNRVEIESAHPIQEILASCRFKRDVGSEPAAVRQPATGSHTELR